VDIAHGKPDGRLFTLGEAAVDAVEADGTVTLRREMTPGGQYDGLGVERQAGDVAVTKVTEGRWWYPTTYEGSDGERRGTYVNVCTPVEVFPGEIRYVDLHVDVVKHADGTVERVDDDELDAAVDAGHVPEPRGEGPERRGVTGAWSRWERRLVIRWAARPAGGNGATALPSGKLASFPRRVHRMVTRSRRPVGERSR